MERENQRRRLVGCPGIGFTVVSNRECVWIIRYRRTEGKNTVYHGDTGDTEKKETKRGGIGLSQEVFSVFNALRLRLGGIVFLRG